MKIPSFLSDILMKIVGFGLLLLILALSLYATNVLYALVIGFFIITFFAVIVFAIKHTLSKRTIKICFAICFVIGLVLLILLLYKAHTFSYVFGSSKHISCHEDINYCFDNDIKRVSFTPKTVVETQYVIKEGITVGRSNKLKPYEGRIRFYYSIIELDDINILVKHSHPTLHNNKTLEAYLSKLDDDDMQIYNVFVDNNLHKSIIISDSEILNSDLLGLKMWIVGQFIVLLICVGICIYAFLNYKKRFSNILYEHQQEE